MQVAMARLVLGMLKRGNIKALKMLSKQLKMQGEEMVKVAKHISQARKVKLSPLDQKLATLRDNPNIGGNIYRVMQENIKRHNPKK
jgi:hypothetical protein